jgi:xanthine dehydrogenase YagR molybdenum-binding subunit
MPEYSWPSREASTVIGKVHDRLDGTVKATGAAKYTYDINLKNQLIAVAFGSPYAHCKIKNLDVSGAQKTPGVVHVEVLPQGKKDTEI